MIVASKRVVDAINRTNQDAVAWALRHVIDEALELVKQKSCTADEMKDLLTYGNDIATELLERHASTRLGGGKP